MSPPSLSLRDVTKNFGQTQIIRGVDMSIAAGERHALIGPNGAGKTTLFNLISGRFPITSGEIRLDATACRRIALPGSVCRGASRSPRSSIGSASTRTSAAACCGAAAIAIRSGMR
jgi:branched-chain amino acid transport system ATP-binding protein